MAWNAANTQVARCLSMISRACSPSNRLIEIISAPASTQAIMGMRNETWNMGSGSKNRSRSESRNRLRPVTMPLRTKASWVWIQPFGIAVVPEV